MLLSAQDEPFNQVQDDALIRGEKCALLSFTAVAISSGPESFLSSRVIANAFREAISSGTGTYPISERVLTKEETATPRGKCPWFAVTRALGYAVVKPRPFNVVQDRALQECNFERRPRRLYGRAGGWG